jgi:flagellin
MSNSIQTNVNSIIAQENLRVNGDFQSRTIQRLTSGFRINSSSDDAAGLAVSNKFRSDVAELNQGVRNANDGISVLQIVDGGMNNISKMIDRLRTLATQSASDTFSGDRQTLNNEYQTLLREIDRQAANIGLASGSGVASRYSQTINVYIGGSAGIQSNAKVTIDMGGAKVDSLGLGIGSSNILAGAGAVLNTAVVNGATFLTGGEQTFTLQTPGDTKTLTVSGGAVGITMQDAVDQLNRQLYGTGISAQIDTNNNLAFFGDKTAFTLTANAASAGTGLATLADTVNNINLYQGAASGAVATLVADESLTVSSNGSTVTVNLSTGDTFSDVLSKLNSSLNSFGVYAVIDTAGTGFQLQGVSDFDVTGVGTIGAALTGNSTDPSAAVLAASKTANSDAALAALSAAVTNLGLVQGKIGTGQNQLQYAVQLAQSQVASFSAAESRIRDADIATEAANLTKAQVLQQSSIAALAQANQAPQAILSLLRG